MTTTTATLITRPGVRLAYVLEIEGHNVVYTNVPDLTVWTGYTVRPGLEMLGSVSREIDLLGFSVSPVGFGFKIVDAIPWDTANSLAKLLAHLDSTAIVTELTASVDRDDTTLTVRSTTGFSSPIYVGHERITYSGTTATTFTGCTRGTLPTSALNAAGTAWGHVHKVGIDGAGPEVATRPRVWKNRMVTIYAVATDPVTGTWNDRADALNELTGTLDDYGFQDGAWQFSCTSIEKRLQGQLLKDQYIGAYEGMYIDATTLTLAQHNVVGAHDFITLTIAAGQYTISSLIAEINEQLDAAALTWEVSLSLVGQRVMYTMNVTLLGLYQSSIFATDSEGWRIIKILGWPATAMGCGEDVSAAKAITALSPERAIATMWTWRQASTLVYPTAGVWVNQSTDDLPLSAGEGYIQMGDGDIVSQVSYASGAGLDTFTWFTSWDLQGRPVNNATLDANAVIRYVGDDVRVPIKQVWIVKGSLTRLLLRMLLSTGTTNYNNATYDKWPDTMGCGFPGNLVDIASIEAFGERLGASGRLYQVIREPRSAAEYIESWMRTYGFHLIWRAQSNVYKLVATVPTTLAHITPVATLDGSNTGNDDESVTDSGSDLVRNRITLNYNQDPATGEFMASDTYDNLSSSSEHDEPSHLKYDALGFYDYDGTKLWSWRTNVAAPMCAYFARPIRRHRRSGARSLWFLSVGDVVTLTDPVMPDAVAGTYGVTAVTAWVIAISKNYETYELDTIELLVPPKASDVRYLAPSAILDFVRGDKGYDSANNRIVLQASEFTRASRPNDVTWFYTNDRITLEEVDPADPAAPTTWERVVGSVGADHINLTAALSAPAFDTTKRYYVRLSPYSSAILNTDRDPAVGTTRVVGFLRENFSWGSALPTTDAGTAPSGDNHFRLAPTAVVAADASMAAHLQRDLAYAVNNCYRHVCNQHPISEQFVSPARQLTTTTYQVAIGSYKIWCPPGVESIDFAIHAFVGAGTGSYRVTSSPRRPRSVSGSGDLVAAWDNDVSTTEVTTTSTTIVKITGNVLLRREQDGYTYITVEFKNSLGATATHARAFSAYFAARAME